MERAFRAAAGLALVAVLAVAGDRVAAALGLALPGSVLGLVVYLALLATGRFGWSLPGARLLVGWLGLLIVAPLVAVVGDLGALRPYGATLALAFVGGVATTGLATALLFRLAGGAR